jgi:hypothetical protein
MERQSLLSWAFNALGPFYGLLIPAVGLAVFIGACVVVATSRRPAVIAAYLVFLPLPLLIGVFGSFHGFISSLSVMANSAVTPKAREVAQGLSMGLFTTLLGLLVTFPSFFVWALGSFFRTLFDNPAKG